MRRLLLTLPAVLAGIPLLIILIAAAHRSQNRPSALPETAPVVVAPQTGALPDNAAMAKLAADDPCGFLENCLRRYPREVHEGFSTVLQKQEFVGGSLQPVENIQVYFREHPFSVFMNWLEGARKAERVLYVEGEHDNKLLARPTGALVRRLVGDVVERDVDGEEARQSGRFTLSQFGLKKSAERTLTAWKAAQDAGTLRVEYFGIQPIKELNGRPCFVLRRTSATPEGDGVTELTIQVDTETWLQTGSIARGENGRLIGEYYFRDVKLDPVFKPSQFTRAALTP